MRLGADRYYDNYKLMDFRLISTYGFSDRDVEVLSDMNDIHVYPSYFSDFIVNTDGSLSDITVVRSVNPDMDKEAIRLVSTMPKWKPGKQNGEVVNVKYTLPVTFRMFAKNDKKDGLPNAYYLVDGKHVNDISNIKPADIESIEVFKDKAQTVDKYGPKAKNGVISIKLKKK